MSQGRTEEVRCPKCRAGKAYLYLTHVQTFVERVEAVACRRCGTWLQSRPVVIDPVDMVDTAPETSGARAEDNRPAGWKRAAKSRMKTIAANSATCSVRGCKGLYSTTTAKMPLCQTHRSRLRQWISRGSRSSPPLLLVNGHWIERGQGLPGIPGERSAPHPPARSRSARRSRRKGAVLGTCVHCGKRRVEIVAWELCKTCHEGYRRGDIRI